MASIFDVQGFGALSEWNGQFSSLSANQAFQTIASLGSNSIELTVPGGERAVGCHRR